MSLEGGASSANGATATMVGEALDRKAFAGATLDGLPPDLAAWAAATRSAEPAWLDGEVSACACPNCGAPMAIRQWLMVADCWRCGTSIELNWEQEQALQRLLEPRERPTARTPAPAPPKAAPKPAPQKIVPPVVRPNREPAPAPAARKPPVMIPTSPAPALPVPPPLPPKRIPPVRRTIARVARLPSQTLSLLWHEILKKTPFWLVSAAVHSVLFLLLAIFMSDSVQQSLPPSIRLSEYIDPEHMGEGMNYDFDSPTHIDVFDAGPPPTKDEIHAREDATDLTRSTDSAGSNRPPLKQLVAAVNSKDSQKMFQGRDPRLRNQIVAKEGGTTQTEAAVARGLRWLRLHQHDDGHWNLNDFSHTGDCNGRCQDPGQDSATGATALALLPFLGAGQTQSDGIYKDEVSRALKWLVSQQKADGDLRGPGIGQMYAHAQATIVLCEAYAITHDATLFQAAQNAVDFVVKAQNPVGGWRYSPGDNPGDTSVVGWQLMALRSGKMAGLEVPPEAFDRTAKFLSTVQSGNAGGMFSYMPNQRNPTPAMTAEGLLCREYLGWPRDHAGLGEGVKYLMQHLPNKNEQNIYYWYYGTQVLHHLGGDDWDKWNQAIRDTLLETQETVGHAAGSWTPRGGVNGGHDVRTGGRIYMTALAVCTLEVYYRHLPIYRGLLVKDPTKR